MFLVSVSSLDTDFEVKIRKLVRFSAEKCLFKNSFLRVEFLVKQNLFVFYLILDALYRMDLDPR
jgi:hypothetical protein